MKKLEIFKKRKFLNGSKISYSNKKIKRLFLVNFKKKRIFYRKLKKFFKIKLNVKDINYFDKLI